MQDPMRSRYLFRPPLTKLCLGREQHHPNCLLASMLDATTFPSRCPLYGRNYTIVFGGRYTQLAALNAFLEAGKLYALPLALAGPGKPCLQFTT
jgi:hypothetical protein